MMNDRIFQKDINSTISTPSHRKEENRLLCQKMMHCWHFLSICVLSVTLLRTKAYITSLINKNENQSDDHDNHRGALTRNQTLHLFVNNKFEMLHNIRAIGIEIFNFYFIASISSLIFRDWKPISSHETKAKQRSKTLNHQVSSRAIGRIRSSPLSSTIFLLLSCFVATGFCNSPPRFMVDTVNDGGVNVGGSGIVVRLKEGGRQAGQPTIGTKIFHLKGVDNDGDPLTFGVVSNPDGIIKVQNDPSGTNEANIILARELDAEERTQYEVVLSLTDGRLGSGNFITRSLLILVEDTNDNPPLFKPYPSTVSVKENSDPGTVVAILEATDEDAGIFGQISYRLATDEKDNAVFEIGTLQSVPNGAVVRLKQSLDYETQSVYQLKVIAMDRGGFGGFRGDGVNTATAAVLVKVEDVEDKKPEFIQVPSVTRVSEGVPKHTEVIDCLIEFPPFSVIVFEYI